MAERGGVYQASFSAGIISPRLHGRSDIAKYASGAADIENFIVRPEGGLMRRHGTRFVHPLRDQSEKGRLIPFQYSTVQGYVSIWNDDKVRFIKNRAILTETAQSITGISQNNPGVVSCTGHGYVAGDKVVIVNAAGMVQVNNREFTVANPATSTFELSGVDTTGYTAWSSGGTVAKIVEVASPYPEAAIPDLHYAQSADYMWLTHGSYAPRNLTRTSDTAWTLSAITYDNGPFAPLNSTKASQVRVTAAGTALKNYRPGKSVTILANADIFTADHVGGLFYMEEMLFDQLAVSAWEPNEPAGTVLTQQISSNGNVYLLVSAGAGANTGSIAPSHTQGDATDGLDSGANKKWRYLHSRYGIFRITAYTSAKQVTATIVTHCPSGFNQPSLTITGAADDGSGSIRITSAGHGLQDGDYVFITGVTGTTEANGYWQIEDVATNTFDLVDSTFTNAYGANGTIRRFATWLWRFGAFSAERGYPNAVALHEQRLFYANTEAQPFGVWGSRVADYLNFLPGTNDDDSVSYNIAAGQADPIRWLTSSNDLQLGTLSQEFAAFGGGLGDPITPSNTRIVPQSGEGSTGIQPVKIGTETVYVNRSARKVFALVFDASTNSYISQDLTKMADHLFLGRKIVRIVWVKNPIQCIFALMDDGELLSLTYNRQEQVFAWATQAINGFVEDIAALPSTDGTVDDLWMIVKRTIDSGTKRYIEYLAEPFEPTSATDKNDAGYVDSALEYSGASATALSGLWHLNGETVQVIGAGGVQATKVVSNGAITAATAATHFWVGLNYTSYVRTLRVEPAGAGLSGRTRKVSRVTARILNSLVGLAGLTQAGANQQIVNQTTYPPATPGTELQTGEFDIQLPGDFDTKGQFTLVQSTPLPLDIVAVTAWVSGSD